MTRRGPKTGVFLFGYWPTEQRHPLPHTKVGSSTQGFGDASGARVANHQRCRLEEGADSRLQKKYENFKSFKNRSLPPSRLGLLARQEQHNKRPTPSLPPPLLFLMFPVTTFRVKYETTIGPAVVSIVTSSSSPTSSVLLWTFLSAVSAVRV